MTNRGSVTLRFARSGSREVVFTMNVWAELYGQYALHKTVRPEATTKAFRTLSDFTVTHIPSGIGICRFKRRKHAIAFIEAVQADGIDINEFIRQAEHGEKPDYSRLQSLRGEWGGFN